MEPDNMVDSNINTVKELLLDEEKLITYISLSKDLFIHVNDSKILLNRTIECIRDEQPNLQLKIQYIISGISDGNKARLIVCQGEELDQVRNTFKTIFFEHVYSVCKGVAGTNDTSILLLHKHEDFALCKGLIKSSECIKHKPDDLNDLREKRYETIKKETVLATANVPTIKKESKSSIFDKIETKPNKEDTLQLKPEISTITEALPPLKQVNGHQSNQKSSNPKLQKGIAGFFTKSSTNNKKSELKSNERHNKNTKDVKIEKMDFEEIEINEDFIENLEKENNVKNGTDGDKKLSEKEKVNVETENKKVTKSFCKVEKNKTSTEKEQNSKELSTNSKSKQPKKSLKVNKNRKRVLQVSDSDSEEENDPFANKQNALEESEDEIPPTPMANNIKITSGLVNPKKKRKIVDKTYMGEDGFIFTKKEEVYESCSDNEEEIKVTTDKIKKENPIEAKKEKVNVSPVKKNGKKQSKKQISPPKGKQATMTSFFKRK